jgi:hypothetical protein
MIRNQARIGNFTSSEIGALMKKAKDGKSFGAPALTYIEETNMERRLGRSLTDEVSAKPLIWGKLMEKRAFSLLGLEYVLSSTETDYHPNIPYWSGSKDGIKHDPGKTVIDIKSPITLKSFCQLVDPLYNGLEGIQAMKAIREDHKDGDKYYWQIVSNAIINNCKYGELIVYVPYESELPEIKAMAQQVPEEELSKHYWIAMAIDGDLPFLVDGGYYTNLNIIRFEIPREDKLALADSVTRAGTMLLNESAVDVVVHDGKAKAKIVDQIKLQKL